MKKNRILLFSILGICLLGTIYIFAGSFSGTTNNINPSVINSGGVYTSKSANNELYENTGEIGISTFSSSSYYLYSGHLQTISYPLTITNLTCLPSADYEIKLSWTAPGADGTFGTCAAYDIRYSTTATESPAISEERFQLCKSVSIFSPIPSPQPYGTTQSMTITGLTPGTTYYFAIKSRDANFSWAFLSNGATSQARPVPPAAITNLSALAQLNGDVLLTWTAPGDDGWTGDIINGKYRIKWSTSVETDWTSGNWTDYRNRYKLEFSTTTSPLVPQTYTITGLTGGTTYYFRIWTQDEIPGNWSSISNGATVYILPILSVTIEPPTSYDFGWLELGISTVTPSGIIVRNTGNVRQKYSIRAATATVGGIPWTISGNPGFDKVTVKSAFHSVRPSTSCFGTEDIVWTTNTTSTSDVYSIDGTETGTNVPPGATRKWWILLNTPLDTSTTVQQKIRFYITAEQE